MQFCYKNDFELKNGFMLMVTEIILPIITNAEQIYYLRSSLLKHANVYKNMKGFSCVRPTDSSPLFRQFCIYAI